MYLETAETEWKGAERGGGVETAAAAPRLNDDDADDIFFR
jgi:hypothetical protein